MRSPAWWRAALPEGLAGVAAPVEDWRHGGFGLYIHWPFCEAKCPYCDFNSHVAARVDQHRWSRAFLSEIARIGSLTPGRILNSVFFGGGTPSLMDPETVDGLIAAIRRTWPVANDLEITLEANPTSVEAGRFSAYREAGVTRLSMGLQALNDRDLKRLGRLHSAAEGRAAFDIARRIFCCVSFDLIYARQYQTLTDWRAELREAVCMSVDHLSLYQLTIEDGTSFGKRHAAGTLRGLPPEPAAADMYFETQEICEAAGMPAYETSNHAAPDAQCLHNLIYWRGGDYAGIGPGAHGRLTLDGIRYATEAARAPGAWLVDVERGRDGTMAQDALSRADRAIELLLMGLRLAEGIRTTRLMSLGVSENELHHGGLEEGGFVSYVDGRIRVTAKGRPLLDSILRAIVPDMLFS